MRAYMAGSHRARPRIPGAADARLRTMGPRMLIDGLCRHGLRRRTRIFPVAACRSTRHFLFPASIVKISAPPYAYSSHFGISVLAACATLEKRGSEGPMRQETILAPVRTDKIDVLRSSYYLA